MMFDLANEFFRVELASAAQPQNVGGVAESLATVFDLLSVPEVQAYFQLEPQAA